MPSEFQPSGKLKYRFFTRREIGDWISCRYVVDKSLLLELKSVEELAKAHMIQTINYLRLLKIRRGFLLNFNKPLLKQGIRRISI